MLVALVFPFPAFEPLGEGPRRRSEYDRRPPARRPPTLDCNDEIGAPIDIEPHGRFMMDDLAAISDATAAGFGGTWLPSWLVRKRFERRELVAVPVAGQSYSYHNHAL
ncbi:LysR substrate-binding domain-containing protein [Ochrobactrum sp. Q0168]|uniref:LysR substrate-binding domain-containing protein n=1 Tax=Ochrobactrum sp. Q0168 TaxID=2793241 RepID=UPI00352FF1F4